MIVRIKLRHGRALKKALGKNRHLALAAGALLIPVALMAYVMGFWRLASDIGVTQEFAVRGLFSHWQLWIVVAAMLHLVASMLNAYGRGGEFDLPRALTFRFGAMPADSAKSEPGRRSDSRSAKVS
jgi:hypothetical protein